MDSISNPYADAVHIFKEEGITGILRDHPELWLKHGTNIERGAKLPEMAIPPERGESVLSHEWQKEVLTMLQAQDRRQVIIVILSEDEEKQNSLNISFETTERGTAQVT